MRRVVALIGILLLVLLGLAFAVLNADSVELDLFLVEFTAPLSLALVGTLSAGAILGVGASMAVVWKHRRRAAKMQRQAKDLERELKALRRMPIRGGD